MTKTCKYRIVTLRKITVVIIIAAALSTQAFCQSEIDAYVLMIQQTPVGAGTITPETGVHRFTINEKVTITAMPKPGYIFLYWLGSVDDMTTNRTTVLVDAPKIVIAVFERAEFALMTELETLRTGAGRGGASNRGDGFSMGRASNPGPSPRVPPEPPEIPDFVFDDVPVPEDDPEDDLPIPEDDFPVPDDEEYIPEPATILLLGFGTVLVRIRKNKKQYLAKVEDVG